MIKVANFSNILDIMFAVNAVFGVVIARRDSNIRMLGEHVFSEFQRHGKLPEGTNKTEFSNISYAIYSKFKGIDSKFFALCMTLSFFGVLTPVSLFFTNAFYSEGLEVPKEIYILIVVIFIFISPLVCFLYFRFCNRAINKICSKTLNENEIKLIQSVVNTRNIGKNIKNINYNIYKMELSLYYNRFLNVVFWLPNKYRKLVSDRKLKQLEKLCSRKK
ncbi:hypothetical protein [Vibrio parahaemolyticus]|uniref:hypothetical protein n=1 Tax=Vibrio parahaemolyticus TaxID=670 RepID=UPI00111ED948|nr:hypothetical protein [Vibrio parahaemolyticus]TOK06030.1 hypothetical protein CGI26_12170 [Vibrio parahaemolyticus]